MQSVQFCQRDRLNDSKSFSSTVLEVHCGFLPVQAVEQLPRGVAQIEERRSALPHQKAS